jgi:putative spermidine/putrescine transport system substrate-binding protein
MKMKLSMFFAVFAVVMMVGMVSPVSAGDLTIVGWGGTTQAAHKIAYFEPFTKETGIKIVEDEWNGEMAKVRAMVQTGNVTWDVVQVEAPEVFQGCEEGLFEALDWSKITGKDKLVDDAAEECGAGILIWSTIFAYDANAIKDGPKTWAEFWDVKKWPGKRGMRRGAKMTLEIALQADGVAREDVYKLLATEEGTARAFKKLNELKSHIVWWKAGAEPTQRLAAGDVVMSMAYNAWIYRVNQEEGSNFKIVWDGNNYSMDFWTIVSGSPNIDKAHKFISFSMRPDRQAVFFNKIAYGWTAKGTGKDVAPKMLDNIPTAQGHLDNALLTNVEFWLENGESLEKQFQVWVAK